MAFVIELDWDLLYMQYSTDLGQNWNVLGSSDDPNWYNSSRFSGDGVNDDCYNCVGAQWTGTNLNLTEYAYDLTELGTNDNIIFRFVLHNVCFMVKGVGVSLKHYYQNNDERE